MTQSKINILLADDDNYFRLGVKGVLEDIAIFSEASTINEAKKLLNTQHFDLALVDMNIEGKKSGIELLKLAKNKRIHSITLSSQTEESIIEEAYLNGCNHFLAKNNFSVHLKPYIQNFIRQFIDSPLKNFFEKQYITQDDSLKRNIQNLCNIDLRNKSILITGETGVGKSILGRFLHQTNYDKNAPFVHLNCSEISEGLIESELFGHTKGSFTGATQEKKGKFEEANGGTLFLDEIATMSISMQQKILNAIESGEFYKVGSNKAQQSQFTLITATCENLFEKIANNSFREDLFYRISGINLNIPSLKERKEDIPLLIKLFLQKSPRRVVIKEEAIKVLKNHQWKGNIRELKKFVEMMVLSSNGIIEAQDIHFQDQLSDIINRDTKLTDEQLDYITQNGIRSFVKNIEEQCVREAMLKHKGKITRVISELKISSSAFYRIFENIHQ